MLNWGSTRALACDWIILCDYITNPLRLSIQHKLDWVVFFAPLVAFSNFFVWSIFYEDGQEDHEHQKACHENHEVGEVFEAVRARSRRIMK